jgi:hypothetical protein
VTPEMVERVHGNIVKRANAYLDTNGQNFEHLFKKKTVIVEMFDCCVTSQSK